MKEQYIPTKDLKTGAKVVGSVASETAKALKPYVANEAGRQFREFLKKIRGKKI